MQTQVCCVWIKTSFVGFHRWKEAPPELDYLRQYHRHLFLVKVAMWVTHDDREVEFHTLQKEVNDLCWMDWKDQYFDDSCEQIATKIATRILDGATGSVDVSEDGENGAAVMVTK